MNPELRAGMDPRIEIGLIDFEKLSKDAYPATDELKESEEIGSEELQKIKETGKKLTRDEEAYLMGLAKQGNKFAEERLISGTQYLVASIARRYLYRGLDLEDLIQEGNIGLIQAIQKFDPEKGFRFTTYAVWWIRAGIQRALDEKGRTIRFPVYIKEELRHFGRISGELSVILNRQPTEEELIRAFSEERSVSKEDAYKYLKIFANRYIDSLDKKFGEEGQYTMMDFITGPSESPEEKIDEDRMIEDTRSTIRDILSEREQMIIKERLLKEEPTQFKEIAEVLNVSKQRVKQIEQEAIKKLVRRGRHTLGKHL